MTHCHIFEKGVKSMPKQTFFNLSKEKRDMLIGAAKKEFSRVPFSEASIANIVKNAEISRGSFYQYFNDKEDLFFYILNEHAKERRTTFIVTLNKHEGDIFKAVTEMFNSMLDELNSEDVSNFYQNVFLHLNYKTEKTLLNSLSYSNFSEKYNEVKHLINRTNLNVTDDDELFHVISIVLGIMMQNLVLKFAKELSNEEVNQNFHTQMNLLKKGFQKKQQN